MAIKGKKKPKYVFYNSTNKQKKKNHIFLINSLSFSPEIKSVQLALKFPPNPMLYLTWLLAD